MAATFFAQKNLLEYDVWIAPDGTQYQLHTPPSRAVISVTGDGFTGINYITERAPYQHGQSVKDFFLQPRTIQMIIRQIGSSRTDRWQKLQDFMTAIRPNRTPLTTSTKPQPGTLRRFMPNGTWLDLSCYIMVGPKIEPRSAGQSQQGASALSWDEWAFQETIQFVAENPIYFNPNSHTQIVSSTGVPSLVGPITGPLFTSGIYANANIQYLGEWEEYPSFTLTGPITNPYIKNITTGDIIALSAYTIEAGHTATITLTPGAKSITLDDDTNLMGYLSSQSTLATFKLIPDPVSPGGLNQILVSAQATTNDSQFSMTWFDRYINLRML